MKGGVILVLCVFLAGCVEFRNFEIPKERYGVNYPVKDLENALQDNELISGSYVDFPLRDLWRIMPNNISFAFSEELIDKTITMELSKVRINDFFALVAQQLGVDYTQDDNIFYVGKIDYKQFSVYVSRIEGYDEKEVKNIVDGIRSNEGKTTYLKGGVFILSDRWASIQRINSVLKKLKGIQLRNFDLNIWIVNESMVRNFYAKHGLNGKYSFDWLAGHSLSYSNWSILLNALIDFSANMGKSLAIRNFSAIVQDGKEFKFSSGEKVPVLRKNVSNEGTVSTIGVDYIDVGTTLTSVLVRVDDFTCNLAFSAEISSSDRFIEDYPVKLSNKYESVINIKNGSVVVVGRYDVDIRKKYMVGVDFEKSSFYVVCSVNVR